MHSVGPQRAESALRSECHRIDLTDRSSCLVFPLQRTNLCWVSSKSWSPRMSIDPNRVQKPVRKLRKLLKQMSSQPTQDQVHDLRTNARRLQAMLESSSVRVNGKTRRILRTFRACESVPDKFAIWTSLQRWLLLCTRRLERKLV